MDLTERQKREREFYDSYSRSTKTEQIDLGPVSGAEQRPWNSYWYVFQLAAQAREERPQTVLDFGCGSGENGILLAHLGFELQGFDISEHSVRTAQQLAKAYGLHPEPKFTVQVAENLPYPNESFDLIVGIDILHHVDIPRATAECMRLLKPTGRAIFREPIESPLFDPIRNTSLVRAIFPKTPSIERHVTEDERKLTRDDLRTIRNLAPRCEMTYFRLFSRAEILLKKLPMAPPAWLEKFDHSIVHALPRFGELLAGGVVIQLSRS